MLLIMGYTVDTVAEVCRNQTLWYIIVLFFVYKTSKRLVAAIPLQATEAHIKTTKLLLHNSSKKTQEHFSENKQE